MCNTPRSGTGSKMWHGLIEFEDERHLVEFGATEDGVPFSHVHCLSPHARFCSLGRTVQVGMLMPVLKRLLSALDTKLEQTAFTIC
jgi:hypothetical protein